MGSIRMTCILFLWGGGKKSDIEPVSMAVSVVIR